MVLNPDKNMFSCCRDLMTPCHFIVFTPVSDVKDQVLYINSTRKKNV